MSPRRLVIIAAFVLCEVITASAQDPPAGGPPPRNPLVISITGSNAEPDLYRDVSMTSYELLTGSVQFTEAGDTAKAVFSPFKLRSTYHPLLSEIGFNLAQGQGITTLGVGVAYNAKTAFSASAVDELNRTLVALTPFRDQQPGETEEAYDLARNAYLDRQWAAIYHAFYTKLATRAWIISGAYNTQFFGVIAGDKADVDEDGIIDDFYGHKGYDASAAFTYTHDQATGVTLTGHYGERRTSARQDSALAAYPGWSVAFARRVKILNPNYQTSSDYLSSLFVPAIVLGASFEWIRCNGTADSCEDGFRRRDALTPFIEFKISPTAQFRIGVPVRRSVGFGGASRTELAPAVQYVLQLRGVD